MSIKGFKFDGVVHKYDYNSLENIPDLNTETDKTLAIDGVPADAKATGDRISNLQSLVGSPLTASTAASMVDTDKVYVYTGSETGYTNGNWYYHDGTSWVSGGVYNSVAVDLDSTLTLANKAPDSKVVGDAISSLNEDITNLNKQFGEYTFNYTSDNYANLVTNIWMNVGDTIQIKVTATSNANIKVDGSNDSAVILSSRGDYTYTAATAGYARFFYKSIHCTVKYANYRITNELGTSDYLLPTQSVVQGVHDEVSDIALAQEALRDRFSDIDGIRNVEFELGTIALSNGTIVYNSSTTRARTKQGTTVHFEAGEIVSIAEGYRLYVIYNNGSNWVDGVSWKTGEYTITVTGDYVILLSTNPEGTITDLNAIVSKLTVPKAINSLYGSVEAIKDDIDLVDEALETGHKTVPLSIFPGYLKSDGTIGSQSSTYKQVYTQLIPCTEGDEFDISLVYGDLSNSVWLSIGYYDSSQAFHVRAEYDTTSIGSHTSIFTVPASSYGIAYIRFSFNTYDDYNINISNVTGLQKQITELSALTLAQEALQNRFLDVDGVRDVEFELGAYSISSSREDLVYTNNAERARTKQGTTVHLYVGETINIESGYRFYLVYYLNGLWTDLNTWKTSAFTITVEADYAIQISANPQSTITDIFDLVSKIDIPRKPTSLYSKISDALDDVSAMNSILQTGVEDVSFTTYPGFITSTGSIGSPNEPQPVYSSFIPVKEGDKLNISLTYGDPTNDVWLCICYYDESQTFKTRNEYDKTSVGSHQSVFIVPSNPSGISYLRLTWRTYGDATMEISRPVGMVNDLQSQIDDIAGSIRVDTGNKTYYGQRISLGFEESETHKCDVDLWQTYTEDNIPSGASITVISNNNQGMTIFNGYMFLLSEYGGGAVIDMSTKEILSTFTSEPTSYMHQNSAQFSDIYYADGDEFPLLFVSRCGNASYNSGEHDLDEMLVYRIQRSNTDFTFTLINSIHLAKQTYGTTWGVDNIAHKLYCVGQFISSGSSAIDKLGFWIFDEPSASEIKSGTITLTEAEAEAYLETDRVTFQGCCVHNGKLYLGMSTNINYSHEIWVYDVFKGIICTKLPIVSGWEIEGVAVYDGKIYTSNKSGSTLRIYEVTP